MQVRLLPVAQKELLYLKNMDPELKQLLEQTHALAKDNHQMLRAIRRHQWYSFLSTVIVWVVVLALPFYLYQRYVEPLVSQFAAAPGETASGIFGLPSSVDMQKLINSFTAGQ